MYKRQVLESLTPGQMVIKIVNEELVKLMGSETTEIALKPQNEITVIMMIGLQGAGKDVYKRQLNNSALNSSNVEIGD